MIKEIWGTILGTRFSQPVRNLLINAYGLYLKRNRFTPETFAEIERLRKLERTSTSEILQLQSDYLVKMVHHAYDNVPYYGRVFNEYGIQPHQIQSINDLTRIPILTRDDIRQNYNDLLARNAKSGDYKIHNTSGTTGEKLKFAISNNHHWTLKTAHIYRFYAWAGIHPGDRRITIGARVISDEPPHWVYNYWEDQLLLSIHHLNPQTVDKYLEKIKEFNPVFIQGHPSGIAYLAERALETGQILAIKAVMTTGETLNDQQRVIIEQAFDCSVYDFYGQGEGIFYAFQCEEGISYHESSEFGIIELLPRGNDQNTLCSVVGTSLHNFAMPMLRFETGDLAEPISEPQCSCGRGLPLKINRIVGRIDDRVYLSAHPTDYLLPVTVRMHIKPLLKIGQNYQLHQLDLNLFRFNFVSSEPLSNDQQTSITTTLHRLLGASTHINFHECDKILTEGGKIRNVISNIKMDSFPKSM